MVATCYPLAAVQSRVMAGAGNFFVFCPGFGSASIVIKTSTLMSLRIQWSLNGTDFRDMHVTQNDADMGYGSVVPVVAGDELQITWGNAVCLRFIETGTNGTYDILLGPGARVV